VAEVLAARCVELGSTVARQGLEFGVLRRVRAVGGQMLRLQGLGGAYDEVFLPLHGAHQADNAAVALAAAEALLGAGAGRQLDVDGVRAAFASVSSPGRLERVRNASMLAPDKRVSGPTVLLDVAHNPHGARALAAALAEEFAFRRLVGVVGMLADKDPAGVLEALEPVLDELVVTASASPRALDADELAAIAVEVFGAERVTVEPRLDDAVEQAVRLVEESGPDQPGGGVLITGSVVTAGEARTLFGKVEE
jgi:dihydrofolate synthase / folylpolyglutamate synthase